MAKGHHLANMVHAMLKNSGHNKDKWCFAAKTAADIYHGMLHQAIDTSPYYAWYKIHPSIYDYQVVAGATVLTHDAMASAIVVTHDATG